MAKATDLLSSFVADLEVDFEKNYGKGLLQTFDKPPEPFRAISLGIPALDKFLYGGIPVGKIVEIFGAESTGKTTLMITCAAAAQREGYIVFYMDSEHSLDLKYCEDLGVDRKKLVFSQPDYGEQSLQIIFDACQKKLNDSKYSSLKMMFIVDSVSALVPKSEYEGESLEESGGMAGQARMMSSSLRRMVGAINRSESCALFVNQIRDNIGGMHGPKTTTSGGRALKFYSSHRIQIWKDSEIKKGDLSIGIVSCLKLAKSKLGPPFGMIKINITFGKGIDQTRMLWDSLVEGEIFKKMGSWYQYKELKWQGYDGFLEKINAGELKISELNKELTSGNAESNIETT